MDKGKLCSAVDVMLFAEQDTIYLDCLWRDAWKKSLLTLVFATWDGSAGFTLGAEAAEWSVVPSATRQQAALASLEAICLFRIQRLSEVMVSHNRSCWRKNMGCWRARSQEQRAVGCCWWAFCGQSQLYTEMYTAWEVRRSRTHFIPGGSAEAQALSTSGLNNDSEVDPIMLA